MEERDSIEIANEAYAEMEAEARGEVVKKEEEKPSESEAPKPVTEANKPDEQENTNTDEDETAKDTSKPEEELGKEAETTEPEEEDLDAKIEAHAKKYELSYADAKEDFEKTTKIIEQFKNDPVEMAKALRSKDREYDKLKKQMSENKEKASEFKFLTEEQFKTEAQKYIENNPDKYLDGYKKRFPAKSEILTDEAIIEELVEMEWRGYQHHSKEKKSEMSQSASKVREGIISSINAEDKKFLPEVKAILSQLSDSDILAEDADFNYLMQLAKGKSYDSDIKAAEERGFKRAQEQAKIIGAKDGSGGQKPTPTKSDFSSRLNAKQKEAALMMWSAGDGYAEEESFKSYYETFKDNIEKDKNFV